MKLVLTVDDVEPQRTVWIDAFKFFARWTRLDGTKVVDLDDVRRRYCSTRISLRPHPIGNENSPLSSGTRVFRMTKPIRAPSSVERQQTHSEILEQPMSIDIATLRGLTVAEKLRLVTQLWDDIARENRPIIVPDDVLSEATRRSDELAVDPSLAIDDDELWRRVDG